MELNGFYSNLPAISVGFLMAFMTTTGDKSPHSESSFTLFENETALLSLIQIFCDCLLIYKKLNRKIFKF